MIIFFLNLPTDILAERGKLKIDIICILVTGHLTIISYKTADIVLIYTAHSMHWVSVIKFCLNVSTSKKSSATAHKLLNRILKWSLSVYII